MLHPIDPKIDCVFKALLGAEDNRPLLIHFLNAAHAVETEEQRWLKFFKEGKRLDVGRPPDWMPTIEIRLAGTG